MTGYEEFQETVKNRILHFMPEEYRSATVDIQNVLKNNDEVRAGLMIRREGHSIIPTLYLEQYYREIQEGALVGSVLEKIAAAYLYHDRMAPPFTIGSIQDLEKVKDRLYVQLVNGKANQERLRGYVSREIEGTDLAAVIRIHVQQDEDVSSILVSRALAESWQMEPESLFETALHNTAAKMPAELSGISDLFLGEPGKSPEDFSWEDNELYLLSNPHKINGAATLLYPGLLQGLAERGGSGFFIIPSSIHEVLLVQDNGGQMMKDLQNMVININRAVVDPEEILSGHVLYYDGKSQTLSMAAAQEETEEPLKLTEGYAEMDEDMEDVEPEW